MAPISVQNDCRAEPIDRDDFVRAMETPRRLRVLHVTEACCAGVGVHMLDLAEELESLGHTIHVVYSDLRIDSAFANRIGQLKCSGVGRVRMRRLPHWSDWFATRALARYIERRGPFDIVHGHSTKAGGLTRWNRIARSAAVVYTPHSIFTMNPTIGSATFAVARWVENRLAHRAAALIAVSQEEREHMMQIGLPGEKIHYIPNGLRLLEWPSREVVRRRLGLSDSTIAIGFMGRMAPQKNPHRMVEAFAGLETREGSPLRLLMVGDGPEEPRARRLAHELSVADRVDWLGFQMAADVMPALDMFVMPSRYEGMPYVLMEAASAGVPVVSTAVGGARRCIDHGRTGFIVPCDDLSSLVEAIQCLVDEPPLRNQFSLAARRKAMEFRVENMVAATLDLYERLVTARGPRLELHPAPQRRKSRAVQR